MNADLSTTARALFFSRALCSGDDVHFLQSEWRRQIIKGHNETITNYDQVKQFLFKYRNGMHLHYL